jgi:hypothetical protein
MPVSVWVYLDSSLLYQSACLSELNILYLFPRSEVTLWARGGQGTHKLHAPFSQRPKHVVILGKRNWETVWMTQFRFDDVTITTARQSTSTLTYGARRHHQCNN